MSAGMWAYLVDEARSILEAFPGKVPIPVDAVCAKEFAATATATLKSIEDVEPDDMILDIGPRTVAISGAAGQLGACRHELTV